MSIHPGSVRSLIFEEMDDDSFELIVSDPHDVIDEEPVSLDEFCYYWKDLLINREHTQLNISFMWIAGVLESHNEFANVSSFRPEIFEFNKKVRDLSKRKPLRTRTLNIHTIIKGIATVPNLRNSSKLNLIPKKIIPNLRIYF